MKNVLLSVVITLQILFTTFNSKAQICPGRIAIPCSDCDDNNPCTADYCLYDSLCSGGYVFAGCRNDIICTWYLDNDGDGYYSSVQTSAISPGIGWSQSQGTGGGDCNDNNAAINPATRWYLDSDNDNYYTGTFITRCTSPGTGYKYTGLLGGNDCNDNNASVHPGASEICDGIDQDCDGLTDEGLLITFFTDTDGDGYGNSAITTQACTPPAGYVSNADDCDDTRNTVYPGAAEICDGLDNDCDGQTDEDCPSVLTINITGVSVNESAGQALIPVTLNAVSTNTITVKYRTINGTAKHPKDYTSTTGTLTFLPGTVTLFISVPVISDNIPENEEFFTISLNKPVNAVIGNSSSTVMITENLLRTVLKNKPATINNHGDDKILSAASDPLTKFKLNNTTTTLFPNPANNQVNLNLNNVITPGKINIRIIDLNGRVVNQTDQVYTGKGQVLTISTEAIINGMYFILVTDNRKKQFREKLIIQH